VIKRYKNFTTKLIQSKDLLKDNLKERMLKSLWRCWSLAGIPWTKWLQKCMQTENEYMALR